jgi:group I intron endonuclease
MKYFIYKLTNRTNGKGYIGFTEDVESRVKMHRRWASKKTGGKAIHKAIRKYGWDSFDCEVLYCSTDGEHTLRVMEPHFIQQYGTMVKNGYNMTAGGEGVPGYKFTRESKAKMRSAHLGDKNHFYGKTHPEGTKQKMSEIAKQRDSRTGLNAPNFGKTRSEDTNEHVRSKVSKRWAVKFPDGHDEEITNLKQFCREKELTFPTMLAVASGKQKQHKGYSVARLEPVTCSSTESGLSKIRRRKGHMFEMTFPDGKKEIVVGLKGFCKTHGLSHNVLFGVANGKYAQHKGFKCVRLAGADTDASQEFSRFVTANNLSCILVDSYDAANPIRQVLKHEWKEQPELVKSRLLYKEHKVTRRIFARHCTIQSISSNESGQFLAQYHIQGSSGRATIHLGIFQGTELLGVMTFGKPRFTTEFDWELLRFAVKNDMALIGGAGKLFSYFVRTTSPKSIVSYANKRWNTGNVYSKIGMKFLHDSPVNYFYAKGGKHYSRMQFQKHKLKEKLDHFDPNLTEKENMKRNGYSLEYDSPNAVYGWWAQPVIS